MNISAARESLQLMDNGDFLTKLWDDSKNIANGNKLRTYRLFKDDVTAEAYLRNRCINRAQRRALASIRCGSALLRIETGRFTKPCTPLNERTCLHCDDGSIEDEKHFLLKCDLYNDIRLQLFLSAIHLNPNFINFNDNEKFLFLMTEKGLTTILAKSVHNMFLKRFT